MTSDEVLDALSTIALHDFDIRNHLFGLTCQVSHVRLIELLPGKPLSDAQMLAYALTLFESEGLPLTSWLPNIRIQESTEEYVNGMIDGAIMDIAGEPRWANHTLTTVLQPLRNQIVTVAYSISAGENRAWPNAPFELGPTDQVFWRSGPRFFYLEIHHES
jgi:hypothetical protein